MAASRGRRTIGSIAQELGFTDIPNFNRLFRGHSDIHPASTRAVKKHPSRPRSSSVAPSRRSESLDHPIDERAPVATVRCHVAVELRVLVEAAGNERESEKCKNARAVAPKSCPSTRS